MLHMLPLWTPSTAQSQPRQFSPRATSSQTQSRPQLALASSHVASCPRCRRRRCRPPSARASGVASSRGGVQEDVDRARAGAAVVVAGGPGHNGAAVDGHEVAEVVPTRRRGRQLGHLPVRGRAVARERRSAHRCLPGRRRSRRCRRNGHGEPKPVHRGIGTSTSPPGRTWRRRRSYGRHRPTRVAVLAVGPGHDGVAVDRHGDAEAVFRRAVGGRQLGNLIVGSAAWSAEHEAEPENCRPSRLQSRWCHRRSPRSRRTSRSPRHRDVSLATWPYVAPPSVAEA